MTFLALDLETTGLDAQRCSILEVAAILCQGTLPCDTPERLAASIKSHTVLDTPICYPVNELGRLHWDAAAFDMHKRKSTQADGTPGPSLLDVLESGAGVSLQMAEDKLLAAIQPYPVRSVILLGSSISFDAGFLRHHMPRLHAALHYRLMDVSSLVGFFEDALGVPRQKSSAVAHRAGLDIQHSLQTYLLFRAGVQRMDEFCKAEGYGNPGWQPATRDPDLGG